MEQGREIRLFDPQRAPQDWTDIVRPTECAVFLTDKKTSRLCAADGKPYAAAAGGSCFLFDSIDAAQQFSKTTVASLPHIRCEIFDHTGRSHPPLLVVTHPDDESGEETSSVWFRRRKLIAAALVLVSPPLFWLDWRRSNTLILPTFLAFNCIFTALRLLYWDFGLKNRERERQNRLEAHRERERQGA